MRSGIVQAFTEEFPWFETGPKMDAPRLVLICCEGKTEQKYFEIIADVFRGPYQMNVEIFGDEGQHRALIDHAVQKRTEKIKEHDLENDEVVAWAVCDCDGMDITYNKLNQYAEEHGVHLAFSHPQFEAYLVQHFSQSKEYSQQTLYSILSAQRKQYGYTGNYNDGTKADLLWLDKAIRDKPSIVDVAIVNSNQRTSQTRKPFLTVQKLTEYLKSFELK